MEIDRIYSEVGSPKSETGSWTPEFGSRKSQVGSRKLGDRIWKLEIPNQKSEVGRQTVKVRSWKSEVFDLGLFSNLNFSDFCAIFSYLSQTSFLLSEAPF